MGNATPWVVSNVGTSGDPLLPGSGTQTVSYTVTNGSDASQRLNSVVVTVANTGGNVLNTADNNAPVPGCEAAWFVVDNTGAPATPATLTGGEGASVNGTATVTMTESGSDQDPCKGVTPELIVPAS